MKKLLTNLNKVSIYSFKKNRDSSNCIKKIVVNNTELTDLCDISNGLNSFSTTVGENLVKDMLKHNTTYQQDSCKLHCV